MVKKSTHFISPINPSLNFILFLALAFILVVIVAVFMQATAIQTKARLLCPQAATDERTLVQNLSQQCGSRGIQFLKDSNGCGNWVCKNN